MTEDGIGKAVVLAIDAGTTSNRVIAFDGDLRPVAVATRPLARQHPKPDWVEQDPIAIWTGVRECLAEVVAALGDRPIAALGITNQRETTILWDRLTGKPIGPAIVWQCRRTTAACAAMAASASRIRELSGLPLDPYFSASKISWLLDSVGGSRTRAASGELAFGTVDSWLLWQLTRGAVHATDASNASRTMLYGLESGAWHDELVGLFDLDAALLPEVRPSACLFGVVAPGLPAAGTGITGILGDQQAALFGQCGWQPGVLKNTYGTGLFVMGFTGDSRVDPGNLVSTVAWEIADRRSYCLEGSIFIGGALIQWLRDGLGILPDASASAAIAASVPDSNGVVFVPALAGLGAPYWDPDARGMIIGITQDTKPAHVIRAALESMAWQTRDVVDAMLSAIGGRRDWQLRVDGGACANDLLMQLQADALGMPVERPENLESTAMGAAAIAGVGAGLWDQDALAAKRRAERRFEPMTASHATDAAYARWQGAVSRCRHWARDP